MTRNEVLIAQLNALLRLTRTEQMIAQTRRAQAATPKIERELDHNAGKCGERARLLADSIRSFGHLPDSLGVVVAQVGATLKTVAEQGQDLDEALLGDLALEHQMLDRARFARMLAEQLGETKVARNLERVETAHTSTIEWLMERLGEVAVGGPTGLRPTPVQAIVGVGRRVGQFPARQTAAAVNRSVDSARNARDRAADAVSTNVARTRQLVESAGEIWTAGRDASLKRSEELAVQRGDREQAASINRTRRNLGAVEASELPVRGYDSLTVTDVKRRIERLTEADDVRAVLAYEEANKERKSVLSTASRRLEVITSELAAAS